MKKILLGLSALPLIILPVISVVSCSNDKSDLRQKQIKKFKDSQSKDGSVEAGEVKKAINCGKNLDIKKVELLKYFNIPTLDKGFTISDIEAEIDPREVTKLKVKVFIQDINLRNTSKRDTAQFTIRGFKAPEVKLTKIDIKPREGLWSSESTKLSKDYGKNGISDADKINILSKMFSGITSENFDQIVVEKVGEEFTFNAKNGYAFEDENKGLVSTIKSSKPKQTKGELTKEMVRANFASGGKWFGKTTLSKSDLEGYSFIGEWAFENIYQLTGVEIPESIIVIKKGAFINVRFSGKVIIPNSVISIEEQAFRNSNISELELGNSLVTIGVEGFSHNKLTSLRIPDSVISIGDAAFFGNNLERVEFGMGLLDVGYYAFAVNRFKNGKPQLPNRIIDRDAFTDTAPQTPKPTTSPQTSLLKN